MYYAISLDPLLVPFLLCICLFQAASFFKTASVKWQLMQQAQSASSVTSFPLCWKQNSELWLGWEARAVAGQAFVSHRQNSSTCVGVNRMYC